jgi:CHAT domain-containing protein/Flp pilus assembly protein TadD
LPRVIRAFVALLVSAVAVAPAAGDPATYLKIRRLLGSAQYAEAVAEAKQALADTPRTPQTLEAFVEACTALGAPRDAIPFLKERLESEPDNAYLHYAVGLAHQNADDLQDALTAFREAARREPTFPLPYREIAYTLRLLKTPDQAQTEFEAQIAAGIAPAAAHYGLGFVHGLAGRTAPALEHLERAIALDPDGLDAYRYASHLHFRAGDFEEVLRLGHELQQRALAQGDPLHEAAALNTMAAASLRVGAYDEGVLHYEAALARQRELGDRQGEWSSLDGLGIAYENLGRHEKAREYHRQALVVAEPLSNRRWKATTLHNIGVTYAQERDMAEARRHYYQALALRRDLRDRAGQAYTLRDIGMSYMMEGHPARARPYLEEAAAAATAAQDAVLHALIESAIAESHEKAGDTRDAREHYAAALAEGERMRYPEVVWRAERGLGLVSEMERRFEEAATHFQRAVATIEGVREKLREESALTVFLQGRMSAYESAVDFLYRQHRREPKAGHDREALEYAERAKARAFLDLLAEARADIRKGMTPPQREEERQLLREAAHLQRALLRSAATDAPRAETERALSAVEARLETFERDLRRQSPEYAALRRPEPERLETVQSELLADGDRLIEFMIGDTSSYAWLVSPHAVRMVALPGRAVLESRVKSYRALIGRPPTEAQVLEAAQRRGRELFEILLGPFAAGLDGASRVTIVADGVLLYLPFETLVRDVDAHGDPHYVLETLDVAYAPSASVLVGLNRRTRRPSPGMELLAYGAPVLVADRDARASRERSAYGPLPYARREIESIATLFPQDRRRVRTGRDATESALKAEDLARYRVLHLATHGHTDPSAPARSGLLFAPGGPDEDGLLQGVEILNLDLDADLVVLSACGTGLGKLVRGEGLVGVTRSFFYAGARSLVVSLWDVDDESTADLMKSFYRRLREGGASARALRDAKRAILRSDRPAHRFPYYWASFVLVGPSRATLTAEPAHGRE